jgi:hypothetical protein
VLCRRYVFGGLQVRYFNLGLFVFSIICVFFIVKSSDEALVINSSLFEQFSVGNTIIFNLSSGMLISIWFYFLVVYLPERLRKKRIKNHFILQYTEFKRNLIRHILGSCKRTYSSNLPKQLMVPEVFKTYFKENVIDGQNRWHVFLNNIDETLLLDIFNEFEAFKEATFYLLNNVEVADEEVFACLHRINTIAVTLKSVKIDEDSLKQLSRLLWEILAGFSWIEGYRDYDYFEKMFNKI